MQIHQVWGQSGIRGRSDTVTASHWYQLSGTKITLLPCDYCIIRHSLRCLRHSGVSSSVPLPRQIDAPHHYSFAPRPVVVRGIDHYWSAHRPILVSATTTTDRSADHYVYPSPSSREHPPPSIPFPSRAIGGRCSPPAQVQACSKE